MKTPIITIPSLLETLLPLLAKKNNSTAAIATKKISITLNPTILISPSNVIGRPKTIQILNIL